MREKLQVVVLLSWSSVIAVSRSVRPSTWEAESHRCPYKRRQSTTALGWWRRKPLLQPGWSAAHTLDMQEKKNNNNMGGNKFNPFMSSRDAALNLTSRWAVCRHDGTSLVVLVTQSMFYTHPHSPDVEQYPGRCTTKHRVRGQHGRHAGQLSLTTFLSLFFRNVELVRRLLLCHVVPIMATSSAASQSKQSIVVFT